MLLTETPRFLEIDVLYNDNFPLIVAKSFTHFLKNSLMYCKFHGEYCQECKISIWSTESTLVTHQLKSSVYLTVLAHTSL